MRHQPLAELLKDVEQEMVKLHYNKGTLNFYRRRWKMLIEFARERGETEYSEQLGLDFVEHHFGLLKKDSERRLKTSEVQELRVIRMIGGFQLHRTILRRYYNHKQILTDPYWIEISNHFKQYCKEKDYSSVTLDHYVKQSMRFMDYLRAQGITSCKGITIDLINNYIKTLAGYSYKTVEQIICSLRAFFRFLLETGKVTIDFAAKTPMVQARKQTRIPSVWTKEELQKLFDAIDRANPKGKRDYAIILLACCLGMRCTDIKNLRFNNFYWEDKKLIFIQSKTKETVSLPLPSEVGWAIIDYLKYGRPQFKSPYVFLRHLAPFGPFSESDHLHQIIVSYMRQAHLPTLKKRRGMHSLRHTLASMLLEKEPPLSVISDILGHADPDSTKVYLKVDIGKLKECALDLEEGKGNV
ncbi:MAG: site-specific integrase [Clostridiales bacterium]|nr:site-specific integrase [Clostridiales bacterium]MCF8021298.1 site-specific integrase [Clostridiales bacterium]